MRRIRSAKNLAKAFDDLITAMNGYVRAVETLEYMIGGPWQLRWCAHIPQMAKKVRRIRGMVKGSGASIEALEAIAEATRAVIKALGILGQR